MDWDDEKYIRIREYARVEAYIPIEIKLVSPEEYPNIRSRTSLECALTNFPPLPEVENPAVSECLRILSAKLDTILSMLTLQSHDYCSLQLTQANLSAGGLCSVVPRPYAPGDLVEIRMMFPNESNVVLYVYGRVIHCEQNARGQYLASVEFTEIDEDIRDRIAKFVFEKQREMLRKKRRQ